MKGKWAQGIVPRNFTWVIRDRLAVCERLGGYGASHRKVRRQEEILWVRGQGFSRIISLLPSPHNLYAYEEMGLGAQHVPFGPADDPTAVLGDLYPDLHAQLAAGDRVLVHQEELSDRLQGTMAGYLVYAGLVPEETRAIAMLEHLLQRQMGPVGRELVAVAATLAAGR
ncbi:MAG: hypothetical protein ACRDZ9_03485 [Acidimicrobiales bacterium]